MIGVEARDWIVANAQGPKELLRIASNLLAALALAQIAGADLTAIHLAPPVPWWGSSILAVLAWWGTLRLGSLQEARAARVSSPSSMPPAPPAG